MKLYRKTLIKGGAFAVILLAVSAGIWYSSEQNRKKEVLESIDLIFKENTHIEYGQKEIDFDYFIKEKKGNPDVIAPKNVNTKELGEKELIYKLSKDGYSKEKILVVEVKDTKAPEIVFHQDSITINSGASFKREENIKSVKDPVDGDIPSSKEKKEKNYYTIQGIVDTEKAGEYKITIKAVDKNGNSTEKSYTVIVNEQEHEIMQNPAPVGDVVNSSDSGGNAQINSGNAGGNTQSPTPPPTQPETPSVCVSNGIYSPIGNSGQVFDTEQLAIEYADKAASDPNSPWYGWGNSTWTVVDNCENHKWTVNFY